MMLHRCTQTADDFAVGTSMNIHAERENLAVLYPQQPRDANPSGCWNWSRSQISEILRFPRIACADGKKLV